MEAQLYHRTDGPSPQTVVCDLCHHRCTIGPGKVGVCRARRNEGGRLVSLVYGHAIALNADPIEKKPLFHFLPGSLSMSVATVGCNFRCVWCQNADISQALRDRPDAGPGGEEVSPRQIVRAAIASGCRSISFTYTEPTVFFEYALDTARLASAEGLPSCFVSNGFMTPEAVDAIAPYLRAINVDVKSFDPEVYLRDIGGRLERVLETLAYLHRRGVWIEVTTLLIPGVNDSADELERLTRHLASLSPDIPWHVSRFFPHYKMNHVAPTSARSVLAAIEIGRAAGLRHIYCGNMPDRRWESTWCAQCGALLIERAGYTVTAQPMGEDGRCPRCATVCPGVWSLSSATA